MCRYSNVVLAYALYTPFCIIGLTLPTVLIGPVVRRKEVGDCRAKTIGSSAHTYV